MMTSAPTPMLQKLAKMVSDPNLKRLLAMPEQGRLQAMDQTWKQMVAKGADAQAASAAIDLGPLLTESEAISKMVLQTGDPGLRAMLPEVMTPQELGQLMEADRMLNPKQIEQALSLVANPPKS